MYKRFHNYKTLYIALHSSIVSYPSMMSFPWCLLSLLPVMAAGLPDSCGEPAVPPQPPAELGERVINGEEVTPHSFPWQVSIKGHIDEHYCGGAILSPHWVLTAAHCADIVFIGTYFGDEVVVGQHDRSARGSR